MTKNTKEANTTAKSELAKRSANNTAQTGGNSYLSTQPYKGARDFYPEDMRARNYIFETWKRVCLRYGFEEYDFPIMEPFEIFSAKTGAEIVNEQLYTLEDRAGRKLAIRPELTPGTVRMIAAKYKELQRPIRWFMIGNNWRAEKPQLGRGREFYQLEVNTFGVDSILADYEIITLIIDIMKEFGAGEKQYELLISDRRLVEALLKDYLGLEADAMLAVRRLMDKRAKISAEDFKAALTDLGLDLDKITKIEEFLSTDFKSLNKTIPQELLEKNQGYKVLQQLFTLLAVNNYDKYCKFDPKIIRGFDYSDGLVYEVYDKNPINTRSMFGGERFDKLITIFGDFNLPATGFAMGDITLLEFLKGWQLLPDFTANTKYLVTLWPEVGKSENSYLQKTLETAKKLREQGNNVETWLEPNTKLEKQLKYADKKNIPFVVIVGDAEIETNAITIKNMQTGSQEQIKL